MIGAVGVVVTAIAVVWAGATYDAHGKSLIDGNVAQVLTSLIGGALTVGAIFLQRSIGAIKHQVHNNSGSSMKDSVDRTEVTAAKTEQMLQRALSDLARLRSLPSEIAGVRRELRQLTEADQQMRRDFSDHVRWSQEQEDRIDVLEDTVEPRKDKP